MFSIEPGGQAIIELAPDDGCTLSKLMVNSTDVTSDVSNNRYTIPAIMTNTSVTAAFDDISGERPSFDGHEYVDLGLKSGKLWSTMNYGASKKEQSGYYRSTSISYFSSWGDKWRMPTKEDFQELINECEWTWTSSNDVIGYMIKGPSGKTMFLPAAGKEMTFSGTSDYGKIAYYISSGTGVLGSDKWYVYGDASEYKMVSSFILMEDYPIRPISTITKEPETVIFNLTIMTTGNGTVSYDGTDIRNNTSTFEVEEGSSIEISLKPDEGNRISEVKENGTVINTITEDKSSSAKQYKINRISGDTKIEIKFESILYKLTYIVDGVEYKSYEIAYGTKITPEAQPTKEGYTFSGWSNIPTTMPAKDVTVTGTFTVNKYKLTYMVDGAVYKSYDVEYGAKITPEAAPIKEGYTFSGWSNIPTTMPAKDVTVTGSFTKGVYMLTYMIDGEVYKTISYDFGAIITPEAAPIKEGYTFSGWSGIPTTMPAKDVTVTGNFTVNKYKLTYMVDGAVYTSYDVEYSTKITPEVEPTMEGYTFSGWSEIPDEMPANDVIITGTFSINWYYVTYIIDGEVYMTEEVEYGATITPPTPEDRDGYDFAWVDVPDTMPANDIIIYGTYTVGIDAIVAVESDVKIFTVSGKPLSKLQKGVNIIRYKDGRTQKIVVK